MAFFISSCIWEKPISIIGRFFQRQYDMLMATVEVPLPLRRRASLVVRVRSHDGGDNDKV